LRICRGSNLNKRSVTDQLIVLDRDGVINHDSNAYIKSVEEWQPIPESIDAIARLSTAGYKIAVASNQSGVSRGLFTVRTLHLIHRELLMRVSAIGGQIEMIAFCAHGPEDKCRCRKPQPGLLREISSRMDSDLRGVPFVGDSLTDIEAARAVGAVPFLVMTGKGKRTLQAIRQTSNSSGRGTAQIEIYKDLAAVADALIPS
jgi:D-glycero-D-manno-heptose 1,7-bisphosphate phosphatase